jgi:hypothetical protein
MSDFNWEQYAPPANTWVQAHAWTSDGRRQNYRIHTLFGNVEIGKVLEVRTESRMFKHDGDALRFKQYRRVIRLLDVPPDGVQFSAAYEASVKEGDHD